MAENEGGKNILTRTLSKGFNGVKFIFESILTVLSFGVFGVLGLIFFLLRVIWTFLMVFFFKVIPFIVVYLGAPMFIVGLIMGLFFLAGHMVFIVAFVIGLVYYVKNLTGVIYKLPTQ
jgi:hypothetical protein